MGRAASSASPVGRTSSAESLHAAGIVSRQVVLNVFSRQAIPSSVFTRTATTYGELRCPSPLLRPLVDRPRTTIVKLLERVAQLIALTSSSYEEEARSAAFQACKLIREHHLLVITTGRNYPQHEPPTARPFTPPDRRKPMRAKGFGLCPVCDTPWGRGAAIVLDGCVFVHYACRTYREL